MSSLGSLSVEIAGPKADRWYDHDADVGGDGFELICQHYGLLLEMALPKT